jgi:hypothetical protein
MFLANFKTPLFPNIPWFSHEASLAHDFYHPYKFCGTSQHGNVCQQD